MGAWLGAGEDVEGLGAGLGTPGMAENPWNGWESLEWVGIPGMAGSPRMAGRSSYCCCRSKLLLHPAIWDNSFPSCCQTLLSNPSS